LGGEILQVKSSPVSSIFNTDYCSDIDLIIAHRNGNSTAMKLLFKRYISLVRLRARSYFIIGADKDDLIQEGMIGLYKAVRDYESDKKSSFKNFADLCVKRQIITAIKTATRQKHTPLNSYISINKSFGDNNDSERTFVDLLINKHIVDPADMIINNEETKCIYAAINRILSPLERQVLHLYSSGKTYLEIAEILSRRVKSVDNAIQRIKRKIDAYLKKMRKVV
jgi:RNA polymerase sporulation-specific sigma factor